MKSKIKKRFPQTKIKKMRKISIFFTIFIFSAFLSCSAGEASKTEKANFSLLKDFMRGFDASTVSQIEENGGIYRTSSGSPKDIFEILKENGVNWIRLRLWYSPDATKSAGDNTLQRTLETAQRIKASNLKFLLDIHYSDTWADPANQKRPAAWDSCTTIEELKEKVSEYTTEILETLKSFQPDMIQIGNEINPGMLVTCSNANSITEYAEPNCSSWQSDESAKNLGIILDSAAESIRKFNPDIKIMIHLSSQKDDNLEWWLKKFPNLDFDYIGLSYYPYYEHGTLDSLKSNIKNLKENFKKEILVAETSWAWTDKWSDKTPNLFGNAQKIKGAENLKKYISEFEISYIQNADETKRTKNLGINATIKNQAAVVSAIFNAVSESGGCGVFYWGGDWIPAQNIPNNWENQAMFDFSGRALPSLSVFRN